MQRNLIQNEQLKKNLYYWKLCLNIYQAFYSGLKSPRSLKKDFLIDQIVVTVINGYVERKKS